MRSRLLLRKLLPLSLIAVLLTAAITVSEAFQSKNFDGEWTLTINRPATPGSNQREAFIVNALASPRSGSLHGRVTLTDSENRSFPGVWRQTNKKVSITFELPCDEGEACGTVVLIGKIKNKTLIKKGDVIVLWDTPNNDNPALFDTSTGKFSGARIQ